MPVTTLTADDCLYGLGELQRLPAEFLLLDYSDEARLFQCALEFRSAAQKAQVVADSWHGMSYLYKPYKARCFGETLVSGVTILLSSENTISLSLAFKKAITTSSVAGGVAPENSDLFVLRRFGYLRGSIIFMIENLEHATTHLSMAAGRSGVGGAFRWLGVPIQYVHPR